jgi:hypothetical protein
LADCPRVADAIEKYKKALTVDEKFPFAYTHWANVLRDLKQPAEAIKV